MSSLHHICAAHLSSAGTLKFPLTRWGCASELKAQKAGEEAADSHRSPPSASQVSTGCVYLSVKSQVMAPHSRAQRGGGRCLMSLNWS